jgi:predicted amidophosphoribosyltransferase
MQATLDHFSFEEKSRKPTPRYKIYRFCTKCHKWVPRELDYCPYCFKTQLKIRPKNQRYKKRYNSRSWSLDEAEKLFQRFIERGYSIDEAMEFTEAISGFRVDPKIAVPIKASKDAR